jgi:3-oxoacyl-[acyl-carrier protein] reductase
MKKMHLKERITFITAGAGAGIGQAIARTFAREGAHVVVTHAHEERSNSVAEAIKGNMVSMLWGSNAM